MSVTRLWRVPARDYGAACITDGRLSTTRGTVSAEYESDFLDEMLGQCLLQALVGQIIASHKLASAKNALASKPKNPRLCSNASLTHPATKAMWYWTRSVVAAPQSPSPSDSSASWIGIDITHVAISLMKSRLRDTFNSDLSDYDVIGVPTRRRKRKRALAVESEHDGRYQFEYWALGLVDARPANKGRRGADFGIDGYINFFDDNSGQGETHHRAGQERERPPRHDRHAHGRHGP